MIQIEKTETFGWQVAVRGMRNPMDSWDKSDSGYKPVVVEPFNDTRIEYVIGENDLTLMRKLVCGGATHRKFLRMVNVTTDIIAPLYWWKEFDTYKVGTVANSCSTMHKIHTKELTMRDFSHEHLDDFNKEHLSNLITVLNSMREMYSVDNNKHYWWQMIQLLPSSYNQRRTIQLNYEVLLEQYKWRKTHKLDEWVKYCEWIESLPHMVDFIKATEDKE